MTTDWVLLGLRAIAPLFLYLFLGLIIYQIYQFHRAQQPPNDFLRRLDEPEITLPLTRVTSFGRDGGNTFIIDSEFVSAHHATVTYRDGTWWITDLGSTNGTSLNEIQLQAPAPLDYGDVVCLGDIQFRLEQGKSR